MKNRKLVIGMCLVAAATFANFTVNTDSAFAAPKFNKAQLKARLKKGLKAIPSTDKLVKAKSGGSSRRSRFAAESLSGTPPTLAEIAASPIKNVFWQSGVIDGLIGGSPTENQCFEYFFGSVDGDSGGLAACHLVEGTGYALNQIASGSNSTCYMQKGFVQANLSAGGITVVDGALPAGGINNIFATPTGSAARLVKVNVTGSGDGSQTIFIKIASSGQNASSGDLFKANLYFCQDSGAPSEYETIKISGSDGKMTVIGAHSAGESGSFRSKTIGYLVPGSGGIAYDTTRSRKASFEMSQGDGAGFKADIEVTSANYIITKTVENFGGHERKALSKARFSGSGFDLRVLEGAFKEIVDFDSQPRHGATEYRDSYYAAAPSSTLLDDVDNGLSSGFYNTAPDGDFATPNFSCSSTPSVEVNFDMSNTTVQSSVAECEANSGGGEGYHFCHDDSDIQSAESQYFSSCAG